MARRATDICIYALLFGVLALMALVPLTAVILLAPAAALLAYLYARFSYPLPLCVWAVFTAVSLLLRFDLLLVAISAALLVLFFALVWALYIGNWLRAFLTSALSVVLALICVTGICAAVLRASPQKITSDYAESGGGFLLDTLAQGYYNRLPDGKLDAPRLRKTDAGYAAEARRLYSTAVRQEADESLYWLLTGYGFATGGIAFFLALALCRKQQQAARGVHAPRVDPTKRHICTMRLTRMFLPIVFLPALVFSAFCFIEGMRPVTRAVFNILVLLPCAFNAFTLLLHTTLRFRGKARAAAYAVLVITTAAAIVFYEYGVLVLALVGFADSILNVRGMLDYALE